MTAEERIAQSLAQADERQHLKQAHERLHHYRVGVKNLLVLSALPADVASDLIDLANRIEDSEWRIESLIRGGAA